MRTKSGIFFESKLRHDTTTEDGMQVKVNELLVVDAMSFTECETKVTEYASVNFGGEFEILTENKAKFHEIFFSDEDEDDTFYKVAVNFITIDEKSGKEKRSKMLYLVQASSVETARKHVDEVMNGTMADYKIAAIQETAVMDIIYNA